MSSTIDGSSNIKVIARFRPLNANEIASSSNNENEYDTASASDSVSFLDDATCTVKQQTFLFDRVFNTNSAQQDVFEYSLRQTVEDVMQGYNGTVLAYGQTGSGKTYTMMGPSIDDQVTRGAIPRMVEHIFHKIHHSSQDIEYTVAVSYMEIYMERIRDLLDKSSASSTSGSLNQNQNLQIHEDKSRGIYVQGLHQEYVTCTEEVCDVMRQGSSARAVAATNMNNESSRSHAIFVVVVTQKNLITGSQKSGQLFLVDLAGSEKVNRTGAKGQTLEEAKQINKSLSSLGNVINALTDTKAKHVPYRDSKLTRILQESLGGNSRTSLIVNCSPADINMAETISTLRFGVRAKTIRNKAKINSEPSPLELKQLLRQCQHRISQLEIELEGWRSTGKPKKEGESFDTSQPLNCTSFPNESSETLSEIPGSEEASLRAEIENQAYKLKESEIRVSTLESEVQDLTRALESARQEQLELRVKLTQAQAENEQESWRHSSIERKKREKLNEIMGGDAYGDNDKTNDISLHVNKVKEALAAVSAQDQSVAESFNVLIEQLQLNTVASKGEKEGSTSPFSSSNSSSPGPNTFTSDEPSPILLQPSQFGSPTPGASSSGHARIRSLNLSREEEHEKLQSTLMKDLQQRCEQIVELEITLDAVRDQYNLALENSNNKHQQQKIALLQRNLEQLTKVQRQLVEQNQKLKKEVATDEQILAARNQRIEELEDHLREAQQVIVRERDVFARNLTAIGDHFAEFQQPADGARLSHGQHGTIVRPLRGGGT